MSERSELIAWLRGEVVGPGQSLKDPAVIAFVGRDFVDPDQRRSAPMAWRPAADSSLEEVLYFQRETPHRKYGAGLLHPAGVVPDAPDEAALQSGDTIGAEADAKEETAQDAAGADEDDEVEESEGESVDGGVGPQDDFEVTSPDARHPSSLGLSFCARLGSQGQVAVRLPLKRKFSWQFVGAPAISLNGRYELCTQRTTDGDGGTREAPIWRRLPAVLPVFKGHMDNINRLVKEKKMFVAGPFGKNDLTYRGLFILNVKTIEEAKVLCDTDPAIKEGTFDVVLIPWYGSAALGEYIKSSEKISKFKM